MAETTGLLNRHTFQRVSGVRIPLSPLLRLTKSRKTPQIQHLRGFLFLSSRKEMHKMALLQWLIRWPKLLLKKATDLAFLH